jgi:hypothetical protein
MFPEFRINALNPEDLRVSGVGSILGFTQNLDRSDGPHDAIKIALKKGHVV